MKHECVPYDYSIPDTNNYNKTVETISNEKDKLQCNDCLKTFSCKQSLGFHKSRNCKGLPDQVLAQMKPEKYNIDMNKKMADMSIELKTCKAELENYKTHNKLLNKQLAEQIEQYNQLFSEFIKSSSSSGNTYNITIKNYIQQNYIDNTTSKRLPSSYTLERLTNGPTLKELTNNSILGGLEGLEGLEGLTECVKSKYKTIENEKCAKEERKYVKKGKEEKPERIKMNINEEEEEDVDDDDDKFTNILIHNYNNTCLHKFLGDFIVQYYTKNNIKHSPETFKLESIIKELFTKKRAIVSNKYNNIKMKKEIVTPLLAYIKEYVGEYWINKLDKASSHILSKYTKIYSDLHKIKKDIESGVLEDDILKYIGSCLNNNSRVCNY